MKDGKISHSGTQEEIIQSVPVKVWSCVVANNEVEMWQKQFKSLKYENTFGWNRITHFV